MVSTNELISLINKFSLSERLNIVEAVLRGIREEKIEIVAQKETSEPSILELAGIFDESEADEFKTAVDESRKIDKDEW
ncbi:MAG: hypothetical protein HC892_18395 [Saprospiraceae bacterium]|nr:hypothetical protein [Saprospiraceae bacterium]